jgi:hypothetical protein
MTSDNILKKQLDEMLAGAETPQEAPAVAAAVASTLPASAEDAPDAHDPLAHLIGRQDSDFNRDPFASMLDDMLAQEGMSKETETPEHKTDGFEQHEWEFKKELKYEEDLVEVICKKCSCHMRMRRDQTWYEAMETHQVNPDCGMSIASNVMDS